MVIESQMKLGVGDSAPDFKLKGIDGGMHSLKDLAGPEGAMIVFMCNHCPYVKARLGAIKALYEKFKGNVPVVGINSNDLEYPGEGFENMKAFSSEMGIDFAYLIDDTQQVAKSYGATCTPDPFLFDKEMKLVYHGRINDALTLDDEPTENIMEDNITKLLNGENVEEHFLPSMGCSIKWKTL